MLSINGGERYKPTVTSHLDDLMGQTERQRQKTRWRQSGRQQSAETARWFGLV